MITTGLQSHTSNTREIFIRLENYYEYENEQVLVIIQIILSFLEYLAYSNINFSDFFEKFEMLTFMSNY
jgi:hypothetical protein